MAQEVLCFDAVQAAGSSPNTGPRRSARFAAQQKTDPSSTQQQQQQGRRQPGASTAQVQRSWLQTAKWVAMAMLGLLVAVLAATNPSKAAFVESIQQLTSKGLGQWAGEVFRHVYRVAL